MKKRLLALCLAAALLLGMMPALTLPTNAAETNVTTVTIDDFIKADNDGHGYGTTVVVANGNLFSFRDSYSDEWTITSNAYSKLVLDHTKEILLEQYFNIYTGTKQTIRGSLTVDKDGLVVGTDCFYVTLKDKETGKFVYYYLTGGSDGNYQVGFLKPDGTTNEYVALSLSGAGNTGAIKLGLRWNINGSVTVLLNGEEKGTKEGVTWTVDATKDAGTAWNPSARVGDEEYTADYDYIAYKGSTWNRILVYDVNITGLKYPTTITHTEYVPTALDAYFTAEALTEDKRLDESSWNSASFEDLGNGLEAAVLVNKGVAYVALMGAEGTAVEVKLGDAAPKTATIANGVAEVAFGDVAFADYNETRTLTVGTATANVTFAAKAINTTGAGASTVEVDLHKDATNQDVGATNPDYLSFASNAFRYAEKSGSYGDVVIDRSRDVTIDLQMTFQENCFGAGMAKLSGAATARLGWDATNYLLFAPHDSATNTHFLAYFTADAERDLYLRFYLNDMTTADVDLGISNAENGDGAITQNDLKGLQLVWHTDGSVTVLLNGVELKTVQKATWSTNTTHQNYVDNPGVTMTAGNDYYHVRTQRTSGNNAYLWGVSFSTAAPATVDITTSLADDLAGKVVAALGDTSDVAALPQAVEHDYLGTVALTWSSDREGLVNNNNQLTIPGAGEDDVTATLTAMSGTTNIWSGLVTVKAADPIVGVFTPEDLESGAESWSLVPFAALYGSTDSVAVLATDINTVYVAVKSADSSAIVNLNGNEQPVPIVDGMGVVKFVNVGLSAYGEARNIKVTTSTGALETKVLFNATEIKLPTVHTNKVDLHKDATNQDVATTNPDYLSFASKAFRYAEKSGSYGDVVIDRSRDVTIDLQMTFQENCFAASMATLSGAATARLGWDVTNYLVFAPHDSATNTHFLAYFTADAERDLYLRFYLNDMTTADVDLSISNAENGDGAITQNDLKGLQLVWHTDGSVTVLLNGVELKTVQKATWSTNTVHQNYVDNPGITMTAGNDYYHVRSQFTGGYNAYLWGVSFSTTEPGDVVDFNPVDHEKNDGLSASLGADIGINFHIAEDPRATITVNIAGEETSYDASELPVEDGKYQINAYVAAAQLTENVGVNIKDTYGFTVFNAAMTVKDYLLSKEVYIDANKALIDALLTYGAAAQKYFPYNENVLATDKAVDYTNKLTDVTKDYSANWENGLEGIAVKSAALRLEEKVVIRYYFTVTAENVDGFTFKCGEDELTAAYSEAKKAWYVDVEVLPQNMDKMYTVTVTADGVEGETFVTYSCMTYLTNNAADEELGELLQSMYNYHLAAVDWKANNP